MALSANGIKAAIHWVPGISGIPGNERQTARHTMHSETEATKYAREYKPLLGIELDGSPKEGRQPRQIRRPTRAPNTLDIHCRLKRGAIDLSR